MKNTIERITGIKDLYKYQTASVAQKMSWASLRKTTRIEDQAYCLLGLFGVHMPPLYGEEEHAFLRLQLEIMANTDDDSIFAWHHMHDIEGLLARSPANFSTCDSVVKATWDHMRPAHVITSQGVCAHFQLIPVISELDDEDLEHFHYLAPLNCTLQELEDPKSRKVSVIALPLERFDTATGSIWRRSEFELDHVKLDALETAKKARTILHVPQIPQLVEAGHRNTGKISEIFVPYKALNDKGFRKEHFSTLSRYILRYHEGCFHSFGGLGDGLRMMISTKPEADTQQAAVAAAIFRNNELQRFGLVIGILEGRAWVDILVSNLEETGDQILSRSMG